MTQKYSIGNQKLKIYTIFRSAIVTKYRDDSVELQNNPVFAISITTRNSEIHKATKSYLNRPDREDKGGKNYTFR